MEVGSYEWVRKELQRTQQDLHDAHERLRAANEARDEAKLQLHVERNGSEAWHAWAAEKTGLPTDTGVAYMREAMDEKMIRMEEKSDEIRREIVGVKCRTSDTIEAVRRHFEEKTKGMCEDNDRQNQQLLDMVAEAKRLQSELDDAHRESDRLRALLAKR